MSERGNGIQSNLDFIDLSNILTGFEPLGTTSGTEASLTVVNLYNLATLNLGSGLSALNGAFTSSEGFDVSKLNDDNNVLIVKGGNGECVDLSSEAWVNSGTVNNGNMSYDVYDNGSDEYILVQQLLSVTG